MQRVVHGIPTAALAVMIEPISIGIFDQPINPKIKMAKLRLVPS